MTGDVSIWRDGRIQILRLARPEKKNALTSAMYAALSDAIEMGDADDEVAAHVIVGSEGIFTAGNDIADFLAGEAGKPGATSEVLRFVRLLPLIEKPLVAAVDGLAVGIGTTLLFHCDLVYASPNARFSTPFLDLGLVPEAGSSLLMPRVMGYQRAFELLVLGDVFDALRGVEAGFVNQVVEAFELEACAVGAAKRLAGKPPEALATARRLLRGDSAEIADRIEEEVKAFKSRLSSPEAREAFQAFLEKRPPRFLPPSV